MAHPVLQPFIHMTGFLAKLLGPDYEVLLYDLTDPEQSVIAIANGHISGRALGSPLTDADLRTLAESRRRGEGYLVNATSAGTGRAGLLRCSTFFIPAEDGRPVGMLCVNFDDSHYRELSENVLRLCHPDSFVESNFAYNQDLIFQSGISAAPADDAVPATAAQLIQRTLAERGVPARRLTQAERVDVVALLDEKGLFLMKGAAEQVAGALHCSRASVYRYLQQARNQ